MLDYVFDEKIIIIITNKQIYLFIMMGNNYTFISEDDLLFKILNNVSSLKMTENKQLIQKNKIKDEIMNKIMK